MQKQLLTLVLSRPELTYSVEPMLNGKLMYFVDHKNMIENDPSDQPQRQNLPFVPVLYQRVSVNFCSLLDGTATVCYTLPLPSRAQSLDWPPPAVASMLALRQHQGAVLRKAMRSSMEDHCTEAN